MTTALKNPVERKLTDIELLWLETTEDEQSRLYICRTAQDSDRLIHGFFALQQQPQNDYTVPDLFINCQAVFDINYNYCQQIATELVERYDITEIAGVRWSYKSLLPCYSISSLMNLLESFTDYHKEGLRYLVLVLTPKQISNAEAFNRFIDDLLNNSIAEKVRIVLTDSFENTYWNPLKENFPKEVKVLEVNVDEDELMRQILNESPTSDGAAALRFRQLMVDTFTTLKTGTAEQVDKRAKQALQIAKENSWFDQQVVMYSMIAGGYLKDVNVLKSVKNYRLAQKAATHIEPISHQNLLITQSLLGEGGAWYVGKEYVRAAKAYSSAAEVAKIVPSFLWVIEGYRVAGSCLVKANTQLEKAVVYYRESIKKGIELPLDERLQTTFMFTLQDLMRIVDNRRVNKLVELEADYQKQQAELIEETEQQAKSLGKKPTFEQIAECDKTLENKMEKLFYKVMQQKENLITEANINFRILVSLARTYIHPYWCCFPDIAHPLDLPKSEWKALAYYTEPYREEITDEYLTQLLIKIIAPMEEVIV